MKNKKIMTVVGNNNKLMVPRPLMILLPLLPEIKRSLKNLLNTENGLKLKFKTP